MRYSRASRSNTSKAPIISANAFSGAGFDICASKQLCSSFPGCSFSITRKINSVASFTHSTARVTFSQAVPSAPSSCTACRSVVAAWIERAASFKLSRISRRRASRSLPNCQESLLSHLPQNFYADIGKAGRGYVDFTNAAALVFDPYVFAYNHDGALAARGFGAGFYVVRNVLHLGRGG